jgi:ketosteroid isomerase-like protein
MSQENVEIIRRAIGAWNRRDFHSLTDLFHEDVELHFIGGFANLVGTELSGRDAVFRFWRDFIETLGGELELETAHDDGGRVVTIGTIRGVGGRSGVPSEIRFGQVWSLRDAKVSRMDSYYEPNDALEAVGLSEDDAHSSAS